MSIRRAIVIAGAGVWTGVPWARAQTTRQLRIAILSNSLPPADMTGTDPVDPTVRALIHGLRASGHTEGHNLAIDRHSAEGRLEREQPTRFELAIHRGAARGLGLTLSQSLMLRADAAIG